MPEFVIYGSIHVSNVAFYVDADNEEDAAMALSQGDFDHVDFGEDSPVVAKKDMNVIGTTFQGAPVNNEVEVYTAQDEDVGNRSCGHSSPSSEDFGGFDFDGFMRQLFPGGSSPKIA